MVKLIVDDSEQITLLEYALTLADIDYELIISEDKYGIHRPYLLVYGIPLDEVRAFNWIKEHRK